MAIRALPPVAIAPPPDPTAEWVSGRGIPHPTGGYDRFAVDRDVMRHVTTYSRRGKLHRLDGPAQVIRRSENDSKSSEEWYLDGKLSREGGPAVTRFSRRETPHIEIYYLDGRIHREGGPAEISYGLGSGLVEGERWYEDDVFHRLDGPAWVLYENGMGYEPRIEWWVRGEQYSEGEHARVVEALATGAPLEWARAFAKGEAS